MIETWSEGERSLRHGVKPESHLLKKLQDIQLQESSHGCSRLSSPRLMLDNQEDESENRDTDRRENKCKEQPITPEETSLKVRLQTSCTLAVSAASTCIKQMQQRVPSWCMSCGHSPSQVLQTLKPRYMMCLIPDAFH
ncbi:unnamed protein product [Pleuronectes platessa]|uniref:Uncharacterized protein n=1 Tax=Pleuronectes platessa TaxID=8262 RepID=A0A9N7UAL6_PLEPL|nr:unnamed protein product [Pleuronectes platessa]